MADRIGIPVAQDSCGKLHSRDAIDKVPPRYEAYKPLHCGGCTVGVVGTRSHSRRVPGGGVTQVMAHYSVTKHGEHGPECPYDFKNRAKQIVRESRGTVVQDGDVYELRLPESDTVEQPDRLPPSSGGRPGTRHQVSSSDHLLTPTLGSAAKIVRLLRNFHDDSDAAERFRARRRGRKIPWTCFCRSTSESADIATFLSKHAVQRHPLALHGTVDSLPPTKSGNTYQLRDDRTGYLNHTYRERPLYVVVRSKNADAIAHLRPGDKWLGYGHWKLWQPKNESIFEIQLWVDGPWSLATLRD